MKFTLFTADCAGNAANCSYPREAVIENVRDLKEAVKNDHVCAEYMGRYRSIGNFTKCDVIPMDIDNDHTEDPRQFITPEKMEEIFADVDYAMVPSRHNGKPKGNRPAAPRYHCFFPVAEIDTAAECARLKERIYRAFPFFDGRALDAARFLFGCEVDEVIWHEGWLNVTDVLDDAPLVPESPQDTGNASEDGVIQEGSRNNAMSRFAARVLKKYGISETAKDAFDIHSKRCDPPLDKRELDTIWNSAVRFYRNKVMTQPDYVPPEEYNADFASLRPGDYSDIGEAKALVKEYAGELAYTEATEFLSYDGTCWRENRQKAVGSAEEFLDMQLAEAKTQLSAAQEKLIAAGMPEKLVMAGGKKLENKIPDELFGLYREYKAANAYYAFVMKYRNFKNIVNTQNTAKPMVAADINSFDTQEDYLNTPEGTYDLKKGKGGLMPHKASDLLTKITDVSPGEKGKELWDTALMTFFCGNLELISYVQETVGLAAIGKVYEEALIIAYGEGRNGKSTFWNTILRAMGTYAGTISADVLTANCRRNVKPEIAELKGKRLIIAAELEEGMRLSTSILKQLCSTDQVRGEKKFKDPFDFTPSHTVVLYTNHLPKVGASDSGTWRRLIVIPFHARIEGKSDIKNYGDYLYEHAAPAVMSWIIEGARRVIAHGHKPQRPRIVLDAIAEYRDMNDWMGKFLEECCETGEGLKQKAGELYQEYRNFCQRTGEYPRSNAEYGMELEKRGFTKRKTRKGIFINGLKLRDEAVLDFED